MEVVPPPAAEDPTWERLEDELGWYDRKSGDNQRWYKRLKLLELAVAASLPVVAGAGSQVWVTGGLAAVIVVLEGALHLYQFQEHWITYRSTAEALKHERYLYLAEAGPYAGEDRHRQLAWPSGSKVWSPRSTPSGRPATSRPGTARKVGRVRTAVVLATI